MENGISRYKFSTSFIIMFCIYFGSPSNAHADSAVKGCAVKYYEAAKVLDSKRASCGASEDGQSAFCKSASKINIPIAIQGFSFTINVGAAYRTLSSFGLIPNKFRKAAKLVQEAQSGAGRKLKRTSKKVAKQIPGTKAADVAKVISEANIDGSLCAANHLLSIKEIRQFVEDKIARQ